jgi:hypothetical protein
MIVVAVPAALWVRELSLRNAMDNAIQHAQRLADYSVGPLLSDAVLGGDPGSTRRLDEQIAPRISDGSIVRVKVWTPDGRVVDSDLSSLIGQSFDLP